MGWFMQIMLNRPLPSSLVPLPPTPLVWVLRNSFWYLTFSGT